MPICIRDKATVALVAELARQRGTTPQEAVRLAVRAELERGVDAVALRDRFAALRVRYPLPPAIGLRADKAFFDDLSA